MAQKIRVTVWNENMHEKLHDEVKDLFPQGIHGKIGEILSVCDDVEVRYATLDQPEHGLTDDVLNTTDVLIWWGHMGHHLVSDEVVEKVRKRVMVDGMGFIPLHSAHVSKPFTRIVGTSGFLHCGENTDEIVWTLMPSHPITAGVPEHFRLFDEMYGEPFAIPQPDALVFGSWFASGYIFRSGCCYIRGNGKIFYFQPGHETCKSFDDENVQKIIRNAVHWAKPNDFAYELPQGCRFGGKLV